ncbi:MMPL family transporter [Actinomadura scrupuli]|uniref:MMPL family transporter n=1 Tax=Actinomadura scrupuli TaxID=559629 RepID=UPI003D97E55D
MHRRRWTFLVLIMVLTAGSAVWGIGVLSKFKQGGFEDPHASSTFVSKLSVTYFGSTNPDVLVLYTSDDRTVDDPEYMRDVLTTVARLPKNKVAEVTSYWNAPGELTSFVSQDRRSTFVALRMAGDDVAKMQNYVDLKPQLTAPGLHLKVAGNIPLGLEFGEQMVKDIVTAEVISMPVLLILTIIIFGAVIAAGLPLVVGMFSVITGLAVLRVITMVTDVTSTALEVVTMMAVGLAIDYSLFIVTRFREELDSGRDRETALANTMATAGRTIVFSGVTVTTALAGLLLFPQMFLRSIGLAGMATVMVAVVGATFVLPTMLAVLGHRIEWLRVPWRRPGRRGKKTDSGFWFRLGHSVMRRPLPYFVIVLTILGVLFQPFLHVQFGSIDTRVLPKTSETRQVVEEVKRDFPDGNLEPIDVVVWGDIIPKRWKPSKTSDNIPGYLQDFRKRLAALPDVKDAKFSGYSGDYGAVRISITHKLDPMGPQAQDLVRTIRQLDIPPQHGMTLHIDVGGSTAAQLDLMASLMRTLPWMAAFVGVMTFLLLFAAFGSIVLPLKAIVMNMLSIGASFGAIVWGFQDGHLADLLDFTPTGSVEATSMVFILAMVFGLSMDYEVFLLSRIREEWDRTHDNRAAVAVGMQKTGGIITSAAVLFLVVIAAFSLAGLTIMKLIGVGLFVAVLVDASLVRSLLVPATMRFLGAANWWLPGPLASLHSHMDLREVDEIPDEPVRAAVPASAPAPAPARARHRAPRVPDDRVRDDRVRDDRVRDDRVRDDRVRDDRVRDDRVRDDRLVVVGSPDTGYRWATEPNGRSSPPPAPGPPSYAEPRDSAPPAARPRAGRHASPPSSPPPGPQPRSPQPPRQPAAQHHPPRQQATHQPPTHQYDNGTGAPGHAREIIPNPDGPGWHWKTAEDDHAK